MNFSKGFLEIVPIVLKFKSSLYLKSFLQSRWRMLMGPGSEHQLLFSWETFLVLFFLLPFFACVWPTNTFCKRPNFSLLFSFNHYFKSEMRYAPSYFISLCFSFVDILSSLCHRFLPIYHCHQTPFWSWGWCDMTDIGTNIYRCWVTGWTGARRLPWPPGLRCTEPQNTSTRRSSPFPG